MPERIRRLPGQPVPAGTVFVGPRSPYASPYRSPDGHATMTRQLLAVDFFRWLEHPHDQDPTHRLAFNDDGTELDSRGPYFKAPGFATCVESRIARDALLRRLPDLTGRDLACTCHGCQPCHGDVLIELANRPGGPPLPRPIVWTRHLEALGIDPWATRSA